MMIKKIEQMDLPKERKDVFVNLYALSDQMYQLFQKWEGEEAKIEARKKQKL